MVTSRIPVKPEKNINMCYPDVHTQSRLTSKSYPFTKGKLHHLSQSDKQTIVYLLTQ